MIDIALPASPVAAYLFVWLVASLDLLVPILTPGALLIAGGALAAEGRLNLILLIITGALGAWCGDLAGYRVGRRLGRPRKATPAWIQRHPVVMLMAARYIPAGRTIATTSAGHHAQPWRAYVMAALTAELLWAGPAAGLGYLGGQFIPTGVIVAVALAGIVVMALVALVRRRAS